jgi:hypothetical protein
MHLEVGEGLATTEGAHNYGNGSGRVGDGHHRSAITARCVTPATAARIRKTPSPNADEAWFGPPAVLMVNTRRGIEPPLEATQTDTHTTLQTLGVGGSALRVLQAPIGRLLGHPTRQ